jgi:small subunit ribosomal protein S1
LHVADISWGRINKPADVLSVGQQIEAKVLKVDAAKRRISIGLKQLQQHPWEQVNEKYQTGQRVSGTVTRLTDFGAFVELEKGVEGLIHLSELSWSKKVRKPSDVVKPGDLVEVVILGVNQGERRISLGLKQALGDPWADAPSKYSVGTVVEGPITSITKFGAFVQLADGLEGMIHVADISAEKRINHPQDTLKLGQVVKAQVLEMDTEKRRLRLGMKQLVPTSLDEYIAEHHPGDVVTGRMTQVSNGQARVELGEGIEASCRIPAEAASAPAALPEGRADLSSMTSMLQAKWKGGAAAGAASSIARREPARAGQVRTFRISRLDPPTKSIELELI